ncbi:hypothetical protein NQ314_003740 [Rhamnusium bicolor]|uniref:Uncharacterized protein n=1 Tax=Rhamnusium bicolor TaxID=1586634 RepID=A0AAV8ZL08_9CUCU|nr:hypothetical protein NQ314_003740 [Rhamnusium bicolor]
MSIITFTIVSALRHPFKSFNTDYLLQKWLRNNDLSGEIKQFALNNQIIATHHDGNLVYDEKKKKKGVLMPLQFQFTKMFEKDNLLKNMLNFMDELKNSERVTNFIQGKLWKDKVKLYPDKLVIPYFLYTDDFEINNPLGSHSGVHSICNVYYSFPCFPQENSKLENIFLAATIKCSDVKTLGNEKYFEFLVVELKYLEETGLSIKTGDQILQVHFVIALIIVTFSADYAKQVKLQHIFRYTPKFIRKMEVFDNDESLEHSYSQSGYVIRLMSQPQEAVDPEADVSENNQGISDDEANNSLENSIIIEDISYQESIQNNPDVEELRSLLISWKQEHLFDYFMVIKRHHIERLLKEFDMGTQILFEHNLEEWRKLMGIPLENRTLTATTLEQSHNIESARSTPDSDYASAGSSLRYSPYSSKSPSDPGSNIMLSQILNESAKASMLSEYFKKFSKFEEEQRNALIGIIARYFEDILEDAEATIRSMKFDNLSLEEFDHCWKACSKYRLDDINKLDSTAAILEKWPFYKQPSGFRLIDMDFTTKHENGDGLLKNWEQEVPKILLFLNGNVKDKIIKFLLNRIKNEDIEEMNKVNLLCDPSPVSDVWDELSQICGNVDGHEGIEELTENGNAIAEVKNIENMEITFQAKPELGEICVNESENIIRDIQDNCIIIQATTDILDELQKEKCQHGEEYINSKGKVKQKKAVVKGSMCLTQNCYFECPKKISFEEQTTINKHFWSLDDNGKAHYYSKHVERELAKRKRTEKENSRKQYSYRYFLTYNNIQIRPFFKPKKDLCDKCEAFKVLQNPNEKQLHENEEHIKRKNIGYQERQRDRVRSEDNVSVVTFDLQHVFALPKANIGHYYYQSKLNIVEDLPNLSKIILWSDNCVPQNRNSLLSCAIQAFLSSNESMEVEVIEHKYSEPGHGTLQEIDAAHSCVERYIRNLDIWTPMNLIKILTHMPSSWKFHFKVLQMHENDYLDYQTGSKKFNYKHIPFTKIKHIIYQKESFHQLSFRETFEEEKKEVSILKTKGVKLCEFPKIEKLNQAIGISEEKKNMFQGYASSNARSGKRVL